MSEPPSIAWPVLLRYRGEVDLTVVESWDQWTRDTDLSGYDQPGILVDSDGAVFDLVFVPPPAIQRFLGATGFLRPVPTGKRLHAHELVALVRAYLQCVPPAVAELDALARADNDESRLMAALIALLRSYR